MKTTNFIAFKALTGHNINENSLFYWTSNITLNCWQFDGKMTIEKLKVYLVQHQISNEFVNNVIINLESS